MTKFERRVLTVFACLPMLAIPASAADAAAKNTKHVTAVKAERTAWPAETLSGNITLVDPGRKLVVIQAEGVVPFDIVVTPGTSIEAGGNRLTLKDLSQDLNKNVSIRFIPERWGDVAKSIRISG